MRKPAKVGLLSQTTGREKRQSSKIILRAGFFFCGGQFLLLAIFWHWLPPQVPLFFSRPWGEEQLSDKLGLVFLPLTSFLVFFLNFLLSRFSAKGSLISKTLVITSVIYSFLCFISLLKIIRLII